MCSSNDDREEVDWEWDVWVGQRGMSEDFRKGWGWSEEKTKGVLYNGLYDWSPSVKRLNSELLLYPNVNFVPNAK